VSAISVRERKSIEITLENWPEDVTGLSIEQCKRTCLSRPNEPTKDIQANGTLTANVLTVKGIWLSSGDTPRSGRYRVCCIVREPTVPNFNEEVNLIVEVVE
jgi:hypothetical protein